MKKRDLDRFTDAFYRIAWHNEFDNFTKIKELVEYVSVRYAYNFDEQDIEILQNDMGLVYARGKDVTWVHRTLKEVAIGNLLASNDVFSERLKMSQSRPTRRMKDLHPIAVLAYCVQQISPTDDSLAEPLVAALRDLGGASSRAVFQQIGNQIPVFRTLNKNHEYTLHKDLNELWIKIANLYVNKAKHSPETKISDFRHGIS